MTERVNRVPYRAAGYFALAQSASSGLRGTKTTSTGETLSNPLKTVTYRYGKDGKTGWNKLLTGVDLDGNGTYGTGETITYDAIGNPSRKDKGSVLCSEINQY